MSVLVWFLGYICNVTLFGFSLFGTAKVQQWTLLSELPGKECQSLLFPAHKVKKIPLKIIILKTRSCKKQEG